MSERKLDLEGVGIGFVLTVMMFLSLGCWFGSCQMKKDAVNSGCARWVADSTGGAKIDWCICEEEE
jgi:hypothetical protein